MIFSSTQQIICVFIFLFFGIVFGIISQIFYLIFFQKFQKKLIKTAIITINYVFFVVFYGVLLNFLHLGEFSITLLLFFILGYFWIKKQSEKSVVFVEKLWYNIIKKFILSTKGKKKNNEQHKKN